MVCGSSQVVSESLACMVGSFSCEPFGPHVAPIFSYKQNLLRHLTLTGDELIL